MPGKRHLRQTTLLNYNRPPTTLVPIRPRRVSSSMPKRKARGESECSDHRTPESEDVHATKSEPKLSNKIRKAPKRRRIVHDDSSTEDNIGSVRAKDGEDSDSAEKVTPIQKGKRMRILSDSSNSDLVPPMVKKPVTQVRRRIQETPEVDEDVEEEVDKESILPTRFRTRGKMTTFQKNLEKLKRRKLGKRVDSPSPSESSDGSEENDSDDAKPFRGAKPRTEADDHNSLFSGDTDDSDSSSNFIVEDDGVLPQALPAQFSMETHQDISWQFKKVFQFFVHIAVRAPAERHEFMFKQLRDEEYFSLPLKILRRKLMGLRDSLVASSVWRPEFKRALGKYPDFGLTELSYAVPGCDACRLGGRKSTLVGRLTGLPYDRVGFGTSTEELDNDGQEFNLGRFCAKRTRVYHEFTHWEYALFKCVREEVDDLHAAKQSKGFIRVSYSGRKRPPKDLGDADGIFEWLDDRNIIDIEWQRIKDMMESARHLDMINKEDAD